MFDRRALVLTLCGLHAGPLAAAATCFASNIAMNMGAYGDGLAAVDSIAQFSVSCTRNGGAVTFPITVGIGASANSGGVSPRKLRWSAGADLLSYNLYRDSSRVSVWGNTAGIDTVTQNITVPNKGSASLGFVIYGRIDARQNPHPGTYGDALVLTISY